MSSKRLPNSVGAKVLQEREMSASVAQARTKGKGYKGAELVWDVQTQLR